MTADGNLKDHLITGYNMSEQEIDTCESAYRHALTYWNKYRSSVTGDGFSSFEFLKFYDSLIYYICLHDLQFLGESKYDRFIAHHVYMFK